MSSAKRITKPITTPIIASAPGKVILCGEYALMHGAPALAVATSARLHTTIALTSGKTNTPGIEIHAEPYVQARLSWQDIQNPTKHADPTTRLIARMLHTICHEALNDVATLPNIRITIQSALPQGSGFGSSAALAASLFYAWQEVQGQMPSLADAYEATLQCEHIAHGKSGGLDPYLATYGGVCGWQAGKPHKRPCSLSGFYAGFSGQSMASTHECVAKVNQTHPAHHPIWQDFRAICATFLDTNHNDTRLAAMREHHRLQTALGVVPEMVQARIADIEAKGAAAKVSGAGSIKGDAAGALILYDPHQRIIKIPDNDTDKSMTKDADNPEHSTSHNASYAPYTTYTPLSATHPGARIVPESAPLK